MATDGIWDARAEGLIDLFGWDGDAVMEGDGLILISEEDFVDGGIDGAFHTGKLLIFLGLEQVGFFVQAIEFGDDAVSRGAVEVIGGGFLKGEVVVTDDHVLRWDTNWFAIFWTKDVIGREHELKGFLLSGFGKWDVDGHLVTVEVGVEARADEWVETDGAAFDELRLEGVDTKSMEGRSAVEKDWVLTDDFFDDVEDDWIVSIDVFVSLLVGGDIAIADQDRGDERT